MRLGVTLLYAKSFIRNRRNRPIYLILLSSDSNERELLKPDAGLQP